MGGGFIYAIIVFIIAIIIIVFSAIAIFYLSKLRAGNVLTTNQVNAIFYTQIIALILAIIIFIWSIFVFVAGSGDRTEVIETEEVVPVEQISMDAFGNKTVTTGNVIRSTQSEFVPAPVVPTTTYVQLSQPVAPAPPGVTVKGIDGKTYNQCREAPTQAPINAFVVPNPQDQFFANPVQQPGRTVVVQPQVGFQTQPGLPQAYRPL